MKKTALLITFVLVLTMVSQATMGYYMKNRDDLSFHNSVRGVDTGEYVYNYQNYYRQFPNSRHAESYQEYVDRNAYKRNDELRQMYNDLYFKRMISPYSTITMPSNKGNKVYGEPIQQRKKIREKMQQRKTLEREQTHERAQERKSRSRSGGYNPFYGLPHMRQHHCHGERACHYHNKFPNS